MANYYTIDNTALLSIAQAALEGRKTGLPFVHLRLLIMSALGSLVAAAWPGLLVCMTFSLVACDQAANSKSAAGRQGLGKPAVAGSEPQSAGVGELEGAGSAEQAALPLAAVFPATFKADKLPVLPPEFTQLPPADFTKLRATLGNDADQWQKAQLELYQAWGAVAPQAALADAQQSNPGAGTVCSGAVLRGWIGQDPNAANAWLAKQPVGAERGLLACEFVSAAGAESVPLLADWVGAQVQDSTAVPLVNKFAEAWAEVDAGAAAAWLVKQGQPERFRLATEVIFSTWVKADPRAASEYLKALPASPLRDHAVFSFATHLAAEDAASAETWGLTIESPEVKAACLAAISNRKGNS